MSKFYVQCVRRNVIIEAMDCEGRPPRGPENGAPIDMAMQAHVWDLSLTMRN